MKYLKTTILYILFFVAMVLCSTAVVKVLDLLLNMDYESIWNVGFKVGFVAWAFLSGAYIMYKKKQS